MPLKTATICDISLDGKFIKIRLNLGKGELQRPIETIIKKIVTVIQAT